MMAHNGKDGAPDPVQIGILGASGYTGAELLRLLSDHPAARIAAVTADRHAGKPLASVFPHLGDMDVPDLVRIEDVDFDGLDVVLCGLPHGTTQQVIAGLPEHLKVVDLSADFRLKDIATYAEWYGHEHLAPALQEEAVYGLTEVHRSAISTARLVANPGCYTTTSELPLVPLLKAGVIETTDIIIDAKSGVTGAGRAVKEAMLFGEVAEGMHAYGIGSHRHRPEIEQELSLAAGEPVSVTFTPHLVPMNRGILATIYVKLAPGAGMEELRAALAQAYHQERFVSLLPQGSAPATRHVRGSNHCHIGLFADHVPGRAILVSVLDNLVKGASGQAIQNMNAMLGLPEDLGLRQQPTFP